MDGFRNKPGLEQFSGVNSHVMRHALGLLFQLLLSLLSLGLMIAAEHDAAEPLFPANENGQWGYINERGKFVIAPQFRSASEFSEGLACVAAEQGGPHEMTFIDRKGQMLLSPQFSGCGNFSQGLGAVAVDTPKTVRGCMDCDPFYHWGFIDNLGKTVIQPKYHFVSAFSEGLAAAEDDAGRWGFIDKTGRTVIELQYEYTDSFAEGLAVVVWHKRYGYVDHTGRQVIRPQFRNALRFSESLAAVRASGNFAPPPTPVIMVGGDDTDTEEQARWEYIDKHGRIQFRLEAESVGNFSGGLARFEIVKPDGYLYCGYTDRTGKILIQPTFGGCEDFSEGLGLVLLEGKWHFIDRTGNVVLSPPNSLIWSFRNGLAKVSDSRYAGVDDFGYIDKTGSKIWPRQ